MKKELISSAAQKVKPEIKQNVKKNLAITEQIFEILESKGWTQKDLAKKMGKHESEVSKWLSGLHNLTVKTITKLEVVLGEDIILTPTEAQKQYQETKSTTVEVSRVIRSKRKMLDSVQPVYDWQKNSSVDTFKIA
ncbi:helix-turn-helix domain-containing protein [Microscilla marina]|uniref:Transcriptional regulator, XRE family n=1 Tax=Microscilla marina ATCC 23134 TaxID=313606 RepID=A2A0F6_MICM2|nr:helix-turn-helix transcriptional regulator [Microscilla marina]EAY23883.1 transcriptional regulator, XRE family [Microscilla marina ATCC 23134]